MKPYEKFNILKEEFPDTLKDIGNVIQKGILSKKFKSIELTHEEIEQLYKAKDICELKIIQMWNHLDNENFKILCSIFFDIATLLDHHIENENEKDIYIYEYLKIISLGYLGEHSHFVKDFLKKNLEKIENITITDKWNTRLLVYSFQVITSLVIKQSWQDISKSIEKINILRNEQKQFEETFLNQFDQKTQPYAAAEIVSLYHFAKTVELLGQYLLEGRVEDNKYDVESKIKYHLNIANEFAEASGNMVLELLYKYYEAFSIKLIKNTIWNNLKSINHWISEFNKFLTKRDKQPIFELLYPQKESIIKGGLLNPVYSTIVISLPTSSGKTLIAEYKILQALNEFQKKGGWVSYLVPTKALVNQIYLRLKQDLGGIGIKIEKASGVLEIDGFESFLIENKGDNTDFDVLVTTYEKLNLLIRQGLGTTEKRPLVLTIVDEAHNIEEEQRGLSLEILLATIKNDCRESNFLLLAPDIPNAKQIAEWLSGDRGQHINIEYEWWQPNERIIGAVIAEGNKNKFKIDIQVLNTIKGTYKISERIPLIPLKNHEINKSKLTNSKYKFSAFVAKNILDIKSPIIILASRINETYKIADYLCKESNQKFEYDEDIELLKNFVIEELGSDFPLVKYLEKRIAIHSSAIPDEIRQLIELAMIEGKLQALVATTTIAQGINFPVSAVIMGSYNYPFSKSMPIRDFWNLAGRVGRIGQQSLGWVGIISKNEIDLKKNIEYVNEATKDLISQLESAINVAWENQDEDFTKWLNIDERWSAIFQYISHLRKQVDDLNKLIQHLEEKLHATLGFRQISEDKKRFLINKLREYAKKLDIHHAKISDSTGFSTVTVEKMIQKLKTLKIEPEDWKKQKLFSEQNETMKELVGVMLNTYEIKKSLLEITKNKQKFNQETISQMIIHWVNGKSISEIAKEISFTKEQNIDIEIITRAIYKIIVNVASWGLSAIQKMPNSGINWDTLREEEKKQYMNLPSYIVYGVNTDEAVLMRRHNVPRSVAVQLGKIYIEQKGTLEIKDVEGWLKDNKNWEKIQGKQLNGLQYKQIWEKLNS